METATIVVIAFFSGLVGIFFLLIVIWALCVFGIQRHLRTLPLSLQTKQQSYASLHHNESESESHHRLPSPLPSSHLRQSRKDGSKKNEFEGLSIGIDIGTSNTRFAVFDNGKIEILQNEHGQNSTPTVIASSQNSSNCAPVVFGTIAQAFAEAASSTVIDNLPRRTANPKDNTVLWRLFHCKPKRTAPLSPSMVIALLLSHLKKLAEASMEGQVVKNAVLSVPTSFTDIQRQSYVDAAEIAGFERVRLFNKTTLGALYYLYTVFNPEDLYTYNGYCLIFRMGGGTMESAVLQIMRGRITVVANCGSQGFGGADITDAIYEACLQKLQTVAGGLKALKNKCAMARLRHDCEKKKVTLSAVNQIHFLVELGEEDIPITFQKAELENLIDHIESDIPRLFETVMDECKRVARIDRNLIGHVYLLGGSSRLPKVQQTIKTFFKGSAIVHISSLDDYAIVEAAAIQAALLSGVSVDRIGRKVEINDVTSHICTTMIDGTLQRIVESSERLPFQGRSVLINKGKLQLQQSSLFRCGKDSDSCAVNFSVLKNEAGTLSNFEASLAIGRSGFMTASTKVPLRKEFLLSKHQINKRQRFLEKLSEETEQRRSEKRERSNSILGKLVRSVSLSTRKQNDDDNGLLAGEDFVS